ncbi:MAG: HRDC domain-containing protein [Planctomycetota bacterium]|nr:HRDC domain-containing protein [Planctomycetota bacterium]
MTSEAKDGAGRSDRKAGGNRGGYRQFRRDQSHNEWHGGQEQAAAPLTEHPLASREAPTMVATAAGLADMVEHLRTVGSFAYDSEFIGEQSYISHLCVVQAATTQRVFVLDPLAGLDLGDFWGLFPDAAVEKIVLAGQQDLAPAVLATGRAPVNVVDVQIAAGFVHPEYPLSLTRLLERFVGVVPGNPLAFTHWDKRPLSAVQVRYAADDVRYLPAAKDVICKQLADLGREGWARQEFAAGLEDMVMYRPAPGTLYLRIRGRERLGRRQLAVLRELADLRDRLARLENVPPRTLLKDGVLISMSRRPAGKVGDLEAVRGLPRPVEDRYGRDIIEATARAIALPDKELPPEEPSESPATKLAVDKLLADITQRCQERSVAPALVASRREVLRAYLAVKSGNMELPSRLSRGWRRELLAGLLETAM